MSNLDPMTVAGFGEEWAHYDQTGVSPEELRGIFEQYFRIFPWDALPENAEGFDLGCGSGRWARLVAPRVGKLHCVDASPKALAVARRNMRDVDNCVFHNASVDEMPIEDGTMDFGYSLGVLHHVPDTHAGVRSCVSKLKPGAPFLVYLYYALDNRPAWFRALWKVSDAGRRRLSGMPQVWKVRATQALAAAVYWPLARTARLLESAGENVSNFPLSAYRNLSFYTMQTDALDRLTALEHRFTRDEISEMLHDAGLTRLSFNEKEAFWCAVGYRAS